MQHVGIKIYVYNTFAREMQNVKFENTGKKGRKHAKRGCPKKECRHKRKKDKTRSKESSTVYGV
jgi:hypothetical protein